jgi:hypothetical protein
VQPCLSLLCIPDKPGVKILPFYLKEESYSARLHQFLRLRIQVYDGKKLKKNMLNFYLFIINCNILIPKPP